MENQAVQVKKTLAGERSDSRYSMDRWQGEPAGCRTTAPILSLRHVY